MVYESIKIAHIISGTFLLMCMGMSFSLWKKIQSPQSGCASAQHIQKQTVFFILPLALIQMATGFTLISLDPNLPQIWVIGSLVGFIMIIGSWLSFIYFLLLSQQATSQLHQTPQSLETKYNFFRRMQSLMLMLCAAALCVMLFFMSNL